MRPGLYKQSILRKGKSEHPARGEQNTLEENTLPQKGKGVLMKELTKCT